MFDRLSRLHDIQNIVIVSVHIHNDMLLFPARRVHQFAGNRQTRLMGLVRIDIQCVLLLQSPDVGFLQLVPQKLGLV